VTVIVKSPSDQRPTVIGADPDFKRSGDEIVCPGCGIHSRWFSPSLAVVCPSCKLTGFQFPDHVPTCEGCGTRGLCFVVDNVHWKIWVSFPPEVMQKLREQADPDNIVSVWKRTTGLTLDRDALETQLNASLKHASKPPVIPSSDEGGRQQKQGERKP
jgi:hypothetical protein